MTDLDRPMFAEALYALGEAFNEPVSEVRAEAYFDALNEYPLAQVSAAVRLSLRTCNRFPRPVELRELIEGRTDDGADAAWGAVLREIRRVGYIGVPNLPPRALGAVREVWGSWQRLCETLPGEGPELVGWLKQFKSAYGSVERTEQRALTMGDLAPNVRAFVTKEQRRLS